MTGTDIAVIIGGSLLGFWIVSSAMGGKKPTASPDSRPKEDDEGPWDSHQQQAPGQSEAGSIAGNWFRILEVAESASKDEIASAYKQKIRQYHPDKVANLGPEIRQIAEAKSKEINTAYDHAMRLRG